MNENLALPRCDFAPKFTTNNAMKIRERHETRERNTHTDRIKEGKEKTDGGWERERDRKTGRMR